MGYNINKIAIIGMETVGGQLAAFLSAVSSQIVLLGSKDEGTDPNYNTSNAIKKLKKQKAFFDNKLISKLEIGNIVDDFDMIKDADMIIENIEENFKAKQVLLKRIEEVKKDQAIVASTSVMCSMEKLCEKRTIDFKEKFVGIGFHLPLRTNLGVELIPNSKTSKIVLDSVNKFLLEKMGKNVALVRDTPGFMVYRSAIKTMIKAAKLMENYDLSIDTVEQITTDLIGRTKNMGVFKTMDAIGIKRFCQVADLLAKKLPNEKDNFAVPDFLRKMANSDSRFFKKENPKDKKSNDYVWDRKTSTYVLMDKIQYTSDASLVKGKQYVSLSAKYKSEKNLSKKITAITSDDGVIGMFLWNLLKDFMLYSAKEMIDVVEDYKTFDKVVSNAMNWEVGPFRLWDALGVKKTVDRMETEGEKVPEWIINMLDEGQESFFSVNDELKYIDLNQDKYQMVIGNNECKTKDLGDGVLCIEFTGQGNTLTTNVTEVIAKTLDLVEKDPSYIGIVIANQGKFFSAGANLFEVMSNAGYGLYDKVDQELENFQPLMSRILCFNKPIVAAPFNMTLGGGTEVCLHSHKIVAHSETYMGLVEASVGVIPVAGGTKELLKRFTMELPNVKLNDNLAYLQKAWEIVVQAKMSTSAFNAKEIGYLRKSDKISMHKDYLITDAKNEVINMSNDFQPYVEKKIPVLGVDGKASLQIIARTMLDGNMITQYEYDLAVKVANVMTGNGVAQGSLVDEKMFYDFERKVFIEQLSNQKTLDRMKYKLTTGGKTLRN